jgi:hypothetical protein
MKGILIVGLALALLLLLAVAPVLAEGGGIDDPDGNPLYVIIEVTWDGDSDNMGDWKVWGPMWEPAVGTGTVLSSCTDCLDMSNYTFTFHGKTVHFDEVMVPNVRATPQAHHVVLTDKDGNGTYTGSLAASHYFPWRDPPDAINYFDRIDYEITFDSEGNVTDFCYLQYEHKKLAP